MSIKNTLMQLKFVLCALFIYIVYVLFYTAKKYENYQGTIPDVSDDVNHPPTKSIFFIETSSNEWELNLTARQACSIESAARHNPLNAIYVLFTSPRLYPNVNDCSYPGCIAVKELLKYKNIKMRNVNMTTYFEGTPLENWLARGRLWESRSLVEHTSDVMRFLTLWKFGGTYLDLDVVVLKSFEDLAPNFAGAQSESVINCAVINFDHGNVGHELAQICLSEIDHNFRGDLWQHNGPGVITRVLNEACQTKETSEMTPESCHGFNVLPEMAFYPIKYPSWEWFFIPDVGSYIAEKVNGSYTVHLWNKLSHEKKIEGIKAAYSRIAEINCPNVFRGNNLTL